ncbi:carbohydrate ABC transporter permease [Paenibacillus psychroresistens]|uniref:Carbohydrate ABC transporter permease n=1 Tax=Paenibacillus psychroresistens TaxID=1778678 RepID=A0A6B8RH31_9BACL|nr:carbohydrate ABC transporter permease [Paenibacillus psychroresistens]
MTSGEVWLWPVDLSLKGYKAVFQNDDVVKGYANSLIYKSAGTLISVALTIMIAYPLSRKTVFGRSMAMIFITFTLLFSGGLIPNYLVVKAVGLINTRFGQLCKSINIAIWRCNHSFIVGI